MKHRIETAAVVALACGMLCAAEKWQDGIRDFEDVADVRVAPLVQSVWGQTSDTGFSNTGNPCFNYYTPGQVPCGCSAVAMAQIMRYWGERGVSVAPAGTYYGAINGVLSEFQISAGTYDWGNMPYDTSAGLDVVCRAAIGKLTYDCAVALHSNFGSGGTGAIGDYAFSAFTGTFGYANAMGYCPNGGIPVRDIREALYANLDMGCPVMVSLRAGELFSHEVVVDGYGFLGGVEYVHVNFGWNVYKGKYNGWYDLGNITANGHDFDLIDGIVYNIFPSATGDILSGRVLDAAGSPVANAVVAAACSGKSWQTATDSRGVYAFVLEGGKTYALSCGSASRSVKLKKSVSAVCNWSNPLLPYHTNNGVCGNSWGNDLVTGGASDPEPTPEPVPGEDPSPSEEDALGAFAPGKAFSGVAPYCGAVYGADGSVCGTVSLKIGKLSKKNVSKVSGTIVLLDGKKYAIKNTDFAANANGPAAVSGIEIKKFGTVDLKVGANGFSAKVTCVDGSVLTAETADLSKGLAVGTAVFNVEGLPESIGGYAVLTDCTADGQSVAVTGKKWDCGKAASIKYKKDKATGEYCLDGTSDPKKPNLSGLKLTYTAKTSTFKGSFYVYADVGTAEKPKLKKTSVSVAGVVVNGEGVGLATIKNVGTYSVRIR